MSQLEWQRQFAWQDVFRRGELGPFPARSLFWYGRSQKTTVPCLVEDVPLKRSLVWGTWLISVVINQIWLWWSWSKKCPDGWRGLIDARQCCNIFSVNSMTLFETWQPFDLCHNSHGCSGDYWWISSLHPQVPTKTAGTHGPMTPTWVKLNLHLDSFFGASSELAELFLWNIHFLLGLPPCHTWSPFVFVWFSRIIT